MGNTMGDTSAIGYGGQKTRQSGLDTLRTLAILLVVLRHLPWEGTPEFLHPVQHCGWMGVDLFFVLSGYLIGSQLLQPYTHGRLPSVREFFLRRALRVLPAFLAIVLLYFSVPAFREQPNLPPLWRFLTFTQNFGLQAPSAFSHAWSLCVEEHFYLILPFLVLLLMKKPRLWKACTVAALIFLGGLLLRFFMRRHCLGPIASDTKSEDGFATLYLELIYYPTYTRLDGLLVGVVLAGIRLFRPAWWSAMIARRYTLLLAGFITLGLAVVACWDPHSFFAVLLGFPLLAVGFGLLVVASVSNRASRSSFRLPGMAIGAVLAYSVYLTHKEVINLDRIYFGAIINMNGAVGLVVYIATILAVAGVLYLCVERPFLRLRERIIFSARSTQASNSGAVAKLAEY
jgi:peptidoglycan/LPS O-acetylase OafA/YrhL